MGGRRRERNDREWACHDDSLPVHVCIARHSHVCTPTRPRPSLARLWLYVLQGTVAGRRTLLQRPFAFFSSAIIEDTFGTSTRYSRVWQNKQSVPLADATLQVSLPVPDADPRNFVLEVATSVSLTLHRPPSRPARTDALLDRLAQPNGGRPSRRCPGGRW